MSLFLIGSLPHKGVENRPGPPKPTSSLALVSQTPPSANSATSADPATSADSATSTHSSTSTTITQPPTNTTITHPSTSTTSTHPSTSTDPRVSASAAPTASVTFTLPPSPAVSSAKHVKRKAAMGAAIGVVLFLLCVLAALIFVVKRRRRDKERLNVFREDNTGSLTRRERGCSRGLRGGRGDWERIEPFEVGVMTPQGVLSRLEKLNRAAQPAADIDEIPHEDLQVPPFAMQTHDRIATTQEIGLRNNLPDRVEPGDVAAPEKAPYADATSNVPPIPVDTEAAHQDIDVIASRVVEMLRVQGVAGVDRSSRGEAASAEVGERVTRDRGLLGSDEGTEEALPVYEA